MYEICNIRLSNALIDIINTKVQYNQYSASDWKSSTKNEWAFREERFVEFQNKR